MNDNKKEWYNKWKPMAMSGNGWPSLIWTLKYSVIPKNAKYLIQILQVRDKDLDHVVAIHFMFKGVILMEGLVPTRISVATIFLKLLLKWQGSLGFQKGVFWYFILCLDSLWIEVHHRAPHIGNKHVYVVPSLRQVTYLKKAFSGFLNPFLKNLLIQRKSVTKIVRLAPLPSLFNADWKLLCSFLVSTAWHSSFRLYSILSKGEGEFWYL